MEKKWEIWLHTEPDVDAITGFWLLKKLGEKKFPGIAMATIKLVPTGGDLPGGLTAYELEERGIICVDTGGGRFDHHPQEEHPEECAATLVAKYLEVDDDPALDQILRFVANHDLKGSAHPFDVGSICKMYYSVHPDNPAKVIGWVIDALEVKYQEQFMFFSETRKEYEENAKIVGVVLANGETFRVVTIASDDRHVAKYARYQGAAVVIVRQSTGHTQIMTQNRFRLRLDDIAAMMRLEEQKAKGTVQTTDWERLRAKGKVLGAEEWYYHEMEALLNGSFTAPKVPPTRLSLERITELVILGVNYTYFPNGTCSKEGFCVGERCSYYPYGLQRCRKLRWDARQK